MEVFGWPALTWSLCLLILTVKKNGWLFVFFSANIVLLSCSNSEQISNLSFGQENTYLQIKFSLRLFWEFLTKKAQYVKIFVLNKVSFGMVNLSPYFGISIMQLVNLLLEQQILYETISHMRQTHIIIPPYTQIFFLCLNQILIYVMVYLFIRLGRNNDSLALFKLINYRAINQRVPFGLLK